MTDQKSKDRSKDKNKEKQGQKIGAKNRGKSKYKNEGGSRRGTPPIRVFAHGSAKAARTVSLCRAANALAANAAITD
jgi:hypothetical protein